MRLIALSSLLCMLLLCFSFLSSEGRRHSAKPLKVRSCCYGVPGSKLTAQKTLATQEAVLTMGNRSSKNSFEKPHKALQTMQKQDIIQVMGGAWRPPTSIELLKPGSIQMRPSCPAVETSEALTYPLPTFTTARVPTFRVSRIQTQPTYLHALAEGKLKFPPMETTTPDSKLTRAQNSKTSV